MNRKKTNSFLLCSLLAVSLSFLFITSPACSRGENNHPCKAYINKVCDICGGSSISCKDSKERLEQCLRDNTCQTDICNNSIEELKKTPIKTSKEMICTEP